MAANTISSFSGLNNVTDPLRLGLGWLSEANNINITDTGAIEKREGFTRVRPGIFSNAYSTHDSQRLFLVEEGGIKTFDGTLLYQCTADDPIYWAEANNRVFFNNGTDSGVIEADNSISPWRDIQINDEDFGLQTIALDDSGNDAQLVTEERTLSPVLSPLPASTDVIQVWGGRMYACQYFPTDNQTAIWFSEPLDFHHFRLDEDFLLIPGRVLMLAPHSDALIVGTGDAIYAYAQEKLQQIADYGVVAGQHWAVDGERVLFWSIRGVCSALPFKNLTERQVSMAPGSFASGAIIHSRGQKRYLVTVKQGGAAFNQR